MKHPLHPIIVHFPVATWLLSTIGDVVSLSGIEQISWMAGVLLTIGTITALLAMVTGLMELGKIDSQHTAMKTANQHMLLMLISWSCYAASLFLRLDGTSLGQPGILALILSVAGAMTLCIAGWLGGKLVYEHSVGVRSSGI